MLQSHLVNAPHAVVTEHQTHSLPKLSKLHNGCCFQNSYFLRLDAANLLPPAIIKINSTQSLPLMSFLHFFMQSLIWGYLIGTIQFIHLSPSCQEAQESKCVVFAASPHGGWFCLIGKRHSQVKKEFRMSKRVKSGYYSCYNNVIHEH